MPERGSEPARYEDQLRARKPWPPMAMAVDLSPEERDALADAVEALRAHLNYWASGEPEEDDEKYHVALVAALAQLDGLGE